MNRAARRSTVASYWMFALLGTATLTVVALGWVVARDFRQSAAAANQLYDRFGDGLDLIDDVLFETEEVRRILLYALHTSDANRQLDYVDQSRSAEARVRGLLENRSPILSTARTRAARDSVSTAWMAYLQTRDEVVGLILEGSLSEGVALDEALGTERFNRVRDAIAELKSSFEADAAAQVDAERERSRRSIARLSLIVVSALLLVAIGVYLVNRRASLEVGLRVKTEFLTTMSHELRTPLTGVIGIADLLHTAQMPPDQRELIRMLRTNATTLLGLINNVLDYSRIDAGLMALVPKQFPVQAPVEEALDSVSELAARKGLALGYVIAPGVPDVLADEDRVRQVLLNLLSNAVKYTDTGQVSLHVAAAPQRDNAVAVRMTVRDTGVGIPEALQARLFQWFSHIEPPGGRRVSGTGLGLAISDRLSRLLGGSMAVESRTGEGATFTFVFRAIVATPNWHDVNDGDSLRAVRVLALLGSGIVGEQVRSLLQRWGVETAAHSGDPRDTNFDAVILEADACGEPWYDSLVERRSVWEQRGVPVIIVTKLRPAASVATGQLDRLVTTPIRMQALHEALYAAIRRSPAAIERVAEATPAFDGRPIAVLLVEDNESNRRVVSMMLGELGLHADEAAGGYEAIDRAAGRAYDVILMDVQMPDLDGLDATRRIRAQERGRRATIVALTANVFESDEARCRAAGMDAYLQKPLTLDTLSAALSEATASTR
ncbi:MAG TPA: ATP-binding protein [Vicinamibacterales bacterium]|nr:ATP-binding protein [Vicinamibacterales bacterium]